MEGPTKIACLFGREGMVLAEGWTMFGVWYIGYSLARKDLEGDPMLASSAF